MLSRVQLLFRGVWLALQASIGCYPLNSMVGVWTLATYRNRCGQIRQKCWPPGLRGAHTRATVAFIESGFAQRRRRRTSITASPCCRIGGIVTVAISDGNKSPQTFTPTETLAGAMSSCFTSRSVFNIWWRSFPSIFAIPSPSSLPRRLFSACDGLNSLVDSDSQSVSMADFSFLPGPSPESLTPETRSEAGHLAGDAVSICDLISKSDDGFGEKTEKLLRRYRCKLDGSLVASVLTMIKDPRMAVKFFIWAGRQIGYAHTAAVYDVMVKILNSGGNDMVCYSFVDEIGEEVDKEVVGKLLNTVVRRCCFGGEWGKALEELGRLKERGLKPSRRTYYALIRVFLKADMVGSAKEVRREMKDAGFALDGPTTAAFVYSLSMKEGGWREALGLMEEERFAPDTPIYTRMVEGLCESARFEDATLLIGVMRARSCLPNTLTYTVFLAACLRERKPTWCKKVLRMMLPEGCYPTQSLLHAVIHLFCTFSDFSSAYKLLCKMESFPCRPGPVAYNVFIGAICGEEDSEDPLQAGALDLAEKAYGRMLAAGAALNKVNVRRFACRLCEAGRLEKASRLIHEMMSRGFVPDCATYAKVIDLLRVSSDTERVFSVFEEMKRSGVTPDVFIYTMLVDLLGKAGLVGRARALFDEMVASGRPPSVVTFTTLIHAMLKAGRVGEAGELFEEMVSKGCAPNTVTYTAMVDGYCKAGEVGRARRVFDGMGSARDVLAYGAMAAGLCRAGRAEEACRLVEGMPAEGCEPNRHVYHSVIDGFCKAGRTDRAREVVDEMVRCGSRPNVYVYGSLIDRAFRDGRGDLALPVLSRMLDESCPPNVVVFTEMVDGLCKAGKVEEAGRMMELMEEKGCPPNVVTYTAMIDGLGKAGQVEKSLEVWEEMSRKGCAPNMVTYRVLIDHCCGAGMVDRADGLLAEMRQTCWPKHLWEYRKVIEGFSRDFVASLGVLEGVSDGDMVSLIPVCGAVVDAMCRSGRLERALRLKEEVCPAGSPLCSPAEKGIYSSLVDGLCAAGEVEKAFGVYAELDRRGGAPDLSLFSRLVKGLVCVGRWQDALHLCHGLLSCCEGVDECL